MSEYGLTRGQVAKLFGMAPERLRSWERVGYIAKIDQPKDGAWRRYDWLDIFSIGFLSTLEASGLAVEVVGQADADGQSLVRFLAAHAAKCRAGHADAVTLLLLRWTRLGRAKFVPLARLGDTTTDSEFASNLLTELKNFKGTTGTDELINIVHVAAEVYGAVERAGFLEQLMGRSTEAAIANELEDAGAA